MLFVTLGIFLFSWRQEAHGCASEEPLVANIGHSLSSNGPWSTESERTVSVGATVYFRALDASNNAISNYIDKDLVNGQLVDDTANYSWDWNYQTTEGEGNTGTTAGYSASKSYDDAGNRVVRLYVYDTDGAGFVNDDNHADTVTIKVKLTLETDWMTGVDGQCATADHSLPGGLDGVWATADHTIAIDSDHDTNCTHYNYIGDVMTASEIHDYLDGYEDQGCHLYLMGGHRYKENDDWQGATFTKAGEPDLGIVFAYAGYPPVRDDDSKRATMTHENACHDATVGAIGHCPNQGDPNSHCVCESPHDGGSFCNGCIGELKQAQDLDD